jgi:hypothetical protein
LLSKLYLASSIGFVVAVCLFVCLFWVGLSCREKEKLFYKFISERIGALGIEVSGLKFRKEMVQSLHAPFLTRNFCTVASG